MPLSSLELQNIKIFKDMSKEELQDIVSFIQVSTFSAGASLYTEADEAKGLFILLKGYVKLIRITSDGKEVVLFIAREGQMVGEGAVFQGGTHPASAIAIKKVQALFLPAKACKELVLKYPTLGLGILAALSLRQRMFIHKIAAQGEKSALMRVAGYIKHRSHLEDSSTILPFDISREDLANLLGLARETVSRQLSFLVECQAIVLKKREIHIINPAILKEKADGR